MKKIERMKEEEKEKLVNKGGTLVGRGNRGKRKKVGKMKEESAKIKEEESRKN